MKVIIQKATGCQRELGSYVETIENVISIAKLMQVDDVQAINIYTRVG